MRFFIVTYEYQTKSSVGKTETSVKSNGVSFFNRKKFFERINRENKEILDVVILNIIELNENEYNEYSFGH